MWTLLTMFIQSVCYHNIYLLLDSLGRTYTFVYWVWFAPDTRASLHDTCKTTFLMRLGIECVHEVSCTIYWNNSNISVGQFMKCTRPYDSYHQGRNYRIIRKKGLLTRTLLTRHFVILTLRKYIRTSRIFCGNWPRKRWDQSTWFKL
jgi:hypothetical protein